MHTHHWYLVTFIFAIVGAVFIVSEFGRAGESFEAARSAYQGVSEVNAALIQSLPSDLAVSGNQGAALRGPIEAAVLRGRDALARLKASANWWNRLGNGQAADFIAAAEKEQKYSEQLAETLSALLRTPESEWSAGIWKMRGLGGEYNKIHAEILAVK